MNWFKRIFCSQEEFNVHTNGLPKVSVEIPMTKVKPPKADKNISEPIISFVRCVQENPKRFRVIYGNEYMPLFSDEKTRKNKVLPDGYTYTLKDLQTKEEWTLCDGLYGRTPLFYFKERDYKHTINPEWLTYDEREYIIVSIKTIFKNRQGRKDKVVQLRKDRRIRDERNRLKGIYGIEEAM